MTMIRHAKLSPGKGRWPKKPQARAMRRYLLEAGTTFKKAVERQGGLNASTGAASKVRRIKKGSPEFAEIVARYRGFET